MADSLIRSGTAKDRDWLYQLFRQTNREYIDASWGWDELFQLESFNANLPVSGFRILENESGVIGAFYLMEKTDHLWLELILVKPELQRQGYGTRLMKSIKQTAMAKNRPVKLNVLKLNPAREFYASLGFRVINEDGHSLGMVWDPIRSQ